MAVVVVVEDNVSFFGYLSFTKIPFFFPFSFGFPYKSFFCQFRTRQPTRSSPLHFTSVSSLVLLLLLLLLTTNYELRTTTTFHDKSITSTVNGLFLFLIFREEWVKKKPQPEMQTQRTVELGLWVSPLGRLAWLAGWPAGLFTQYYPSASIDSQVTRRQRV